MRLLISILSSDDRDCFLEHELHVRFFSVNISIPATGCVVDNVGYICNAVFDKIKQAR